MGLRKSENKYKKTVSIILSLVMMLSLTLTDCEAENETIKENTEIVLQIDNPLME